MRCPRPNQHGFSISSQQGTARAKRAVAVDGGEDGHTLGSIIFRILQIASHVLAPHPQATACGLPDAYLMYLCRNFFRRLNKTRGLKWQNVIHFKRTAAVTRMSGATNRLGCRSNAITTASAAMV